MRNWKTTVAAGALAAGLAWGAVQPVLAQEAAPVAVVEREVLPTNARPERYAFTLTPDVETLTFAGEATLTFEVVEPTDRIVVNADGLDISAARLADGAAATIELDADLQRATFVFAERLPVGRHVIQATYTGKINETGNGMFVTRFEDAGVPKAMIISQFEAGYGRQLAPMWDEPGLKAVFEITLVVPEDQDAISNMPVAETTPATQGRKTVRFQPTPVMSSYLMFTGVGDLDRITAMSEGVEIATVTRAGAGEQGRYALETLGRLLPFYNDYFGVDYPLPKMDQIAAPGTSGTFAAMENWGAILYFEPYLLLDPAVTTEAQRQTVFSVVAHEVAHQWFGDIVTMAWWDDLWLNEGFASWMAAKATDNFNPDWDVWLQAIGEIQGAAMEPDALASTHPIIQPILNAESAEFDGITYQKGQAVIRMLETYIGEDAFRAGVRAYMSEHAYGNTVTDDLWNALESASGTPITAIARDFTLQPGVPLITVDNVRCDAGTSVVSLTQSRFGADEASRAMQSWRVPVLVRTVGSDAVAHGVIEGGRGEIRAEGCGPVKVNAGTAGYYRTLYAPALFDGLEAVFDRMDPLDQLGLLYDTSALGTAGYAPVSDYLELAGSVKLDADPLIWNQVAGRLEELKTAFEGQPGEEAFAAYARARLSPVMAHIGWDVRPDEPANVAILRERLIVILAQLNDPTVEAEARRRYAAAESDPAALPPGIRSAVVATVGYYADAETWEGLVAEMNAAANPAERSLYMTAVANVRDPVLAQQALDMALGADFPTGDLLPMITGLIGNHPDLIWTFATEQPERFGSILPPGYTVLGLAAVAGASGSPERMQDLRAFVAARYPDEPLTEVEKASDAVDLLARTRRDRLPEVSAWLAANAD